MTCPYFHVWMITSKYQWICTKLGMCIDIVEICFRIAHWQFCLPARNMIMVGCYRFTFYCTYIMGEWIHFQGRQLCHDCFCIPFEKGSTLKRKKLLPRGANSFLFKYPPFQELGIQKSNQKVKNHHPLQWWKILQMYPVQIAVYHITRLSTAYCCICKWKDGKAFNLLPDHFLSVLLKNSHYYSLFLYVDFV